MRVRLESGEEGEAAKLQSNVLTLLVPRAFAPGSPIRFVLFFDADERAFEGRTLGSKRVSAGCFEVRLRFVNLRKSERELLMSRLG
jgi:hypothetical protein